MSLLEGMSGRARGTKRKADAAAPPATAVAPAAAAASAVEQGNQAAPGPAAAATAAGGSALQTLYAIYISRKTEVLEYDEESYEFDYNDGEDDDTIKEQLDDAAGCLDGDWYYNNSRAGPQLPVGNSGVMQAGNSNQGNELKGVAARISRARARSYNDGFDGAAAGMLVVFDSFEAADAKAAELAEQEAKLVPEQCVLLANAPEQPESAGLAATASSKKGRTGGRTGGSGKSGAEQPSAAAAAAAAARPAGGVVQGLGDGRWQVEQKLRVEVWDEINCIAVSTITVYVVPVALKRGV